MRAEEGPADDTLDAMSAAGGGLSHTLGLLAELDKKGGRYASYEDIGKAVASTPLTAPPIRWEDDDDDDDEEEEEEEGAAEKKKAEPGDHDGDAGTFGCKLM
jgi:hypothetical protein